MRRLMREPRSDGDVLWARRDRTGFSLDQDPCLICMAMIERVEGILVDVGLQDREDKVSGRGIERGDQLIYKRDLIESR